MAGLVPAISILWNDVLFCIEITGTRPVMTRRGWYRSDIGAQAYGFSRVKPADKQPP